MSRGSTVVEDKGVNEASERVHVPFESEQSQLYDFNVALTLNPPILVFNQREYKGQIVH